MNAIADSCPDGKLLSGKMVTDICYECIFPIKIAGVTTSASGPNPAPSLAASNKFCTCNDTNGIPEPGFTLAFWNPSYAVEVVKASGCSPVLGGTTIGLSDIGRVTNAFGSSGEGIDETTGMEYHYYSLPLLTMTSMFSGLGSMCDSGALPDFDPMYFSELDPTHASDELAFFVFPEAAIYARPDAILACAADPAIVSVTDEAVEATNWCAWGSLYNLSKSQGRSTSWPILTQKTAVRALAGQHRRSQAYLTMGELGMCRGGMLYPTLPKTQYRYSYFYPFAEAEDTHVIGEPEVFWGAGKWFPGPGENAIFIKFKWQDCCLTF